MNAYLTSVIENVKKKHGNEPEFVQTVEEVFSSLEPVIEKHPEYEKVAVAVFFFLIRQSGWIL